MKINIDAKTTVTNIHAYPSNRYAKVLLIDTKSPSGETKHKVNIPASMGVLTFHKSKEGSSLTLHLGTSTIEVFISTFNSHYEEVSTILNNVFEGE